MSSLRLALKQSLEESTSLPARPPNKRRGRPPSSSSSATATNASSSNTASSSSTGRPRGRPPKRKPGDPPRKRGRPRKHPLPPEKAAAAEYPARQEQTLHRHEEQEEDASSSEAEFSVSQEDSEHSEEEEQQEHESDDEDNEKRKREHKMKKKARKHSAANKIQTHWKKKRRPSVDVDESQTTTSNTAQAENQRRDTEQDAAPPKQEQLPADVEPKKSESSSTKAKTVPPPDAELVAYMRGLSVKKQKRNMAAGLRVKVRFATKVRKRDGKVATKLKWYGGLVTRVSTGGSKIRIKYDDGTSEVSKFPDKDVIVDETGNGEHRVSAGRFLTPAQRAKLAAEQVQAQEEQNDKVEKRPATSPKKAKRTSSQSEVKDSGDLTRDPPEKKELRPSVSSPKKEKAEKPIPASPERHDTPAAASDEVESETVHHDSDEKMDESSGTGNDAVGDGAQKTSSGERKKPTLKIRLKGPRASIVASTGHDLVKCKDDSAAEEDGRGADDFSHGDDDALSGEERAKGKQRLAQGKQNEENENAAESPGAENESGEEASQSSDNHFARKKRSYDRVTSGDEASEEQPSKKKRAEEAPKTRDVEKGIQVAEEKELSGAGVTSVEEKAEENLETAVEGVDVPRERKRKREEESALPELSSRKSKSPTLESDGEVRLSDVEEQKGPARDESMTVYSESAPTGSEANATKSMDDARIAKESLPVEDVAAIDVVEKSEATVSESPGAVAQEPAAGADDNSSRGEGAAAASIPRFGRRAAQQANERIAARKEIIIQDEFAKKKKQRKEKAELKLLSAAERKGKPRDDESVDDDEGVWVQCDDCSKWRLLPSSVQSDELPMHWYCKMNTYDPDRNTCDAPEQTMQEIAKERRRRKKRLSKIARLEAAGKIDAETAAAQRAALDDRERKSTRTKDRRSARSPGVSKVLQDEDVEEDVDKSSATKPKRRSPPLNEDRAESPSVETGSDSQKARPYKKQSSFGSAGRKSKSDVEDDDNIEAEVEVEPVPKKRGRGRPPRSRAPKDVGNKESDKVKSSKGEVTDPDNQEWVQCELCQKWRRLPPHISADSLPDTWYCSMNTWNSRVANCEAAEDKADPTHQEFGIYGSGVSTASHGNKLSYRNLIFGTGRKQNRIVTERARAAESLFLAPVDPTSDGVSYPKVMYANSSVFVPRTSNAHKSSAPEDDRVSIFDLMSHSSLWAELRLTQPDTISSSAVDSPYDSLSAELKETMKQMVLHAIDAGKLACDEVLLEVQCRKWTSVPQKWVDARASFTVNKVEGCLRDLIADGLIESIDNVTATDVSPPKYRRVSATLKNHHEVRATRCMKIAKPWKRQRPNMSEWLE